MKDNIVFKKIWQDNDLKEIEAVCSSPIIEAVSKIYVSDELIDELTFQIRNFLNGKIEEGLWANEIRGNMTSACLSLRFIKKDKRGHICIEVFAELDDGGNYDKHNCCFFVNTEHGLLMRFSERLARLKDCPVGYEIRLINPETA